MQAVFNTKKTITVYFQGISLPISIYQGTPAVEIENTIRMAFSIPMGKVIEYFDEDATLTVLSSYINSGCKIFAKVKETYTAIQLSNPVAEVKKEIKWIWLTPNNTTHTLENGGLTVRQKQNQSQSYAYGSLLIKGDMEVYYVLIWEKFTCCNHGSVYWTLPNETFTQAQLASSYQLIDSNFLSSGPFSSLTRSDSQNRLLGFYVNMKTKTIVCTDHQKKSIIGYQHFTASAVRPLVFFKHEPIITIKQTMEGCPEWLRP